ncbi:helix-turn-helix domain-containing protein [Dietzia cinnamea]|nr:helix-turn-helix transcriptional regulator [Dietzia cinnamea]MCT1885118.1 helix-turn-helix domain-containing protein [Dietzia cinnamea]MCT2264912.1 helix-turn-helix domain-containing protein [Dietzia cinnamea]
MPQRELFMDPSLARAARALCLVSTKLVALRSGLDEQRIREYERGVGALDAAEVQALTDALTYFGARFIPESDRGGVGVRRKFTRTKVEMIDTWEAEGGPVGEDDV